tara:strand:+ start:100 stop:1254 length:1155 start_codon:yes stop_codon:yes gene_type:complete
MSVITEQYTSEVSEEYKEETSNRKIRYRIEENLKEYPEIYREFQDWRAKQKVSRIVPSFESVMHNSYRFPLFDIRIAEIREDWGQRNALNEQGRRAKILGMTKDFDVKLFEPISVDYIIDEQIFIIRDGGGRCHAAVMNSIFLVPATVRCISSYQESRDLFNTQDKNSASISKYDKFLQDLANSNSPRHKKACDTFAITKSCGICLHSSFKSTETPLVEGIGVLQKILGKEVSGDPRGTKWGTRNGQNIVKAIDIIKTCFPNGDEIPVSTLFALTAFIHVIQNRIPSGTSGIDRLVEFVSKVRDSSEKLSDLNNWVTELKYDSSNNYGTYGAAALMRKWNEVFKMANKGRKPKTFYKYVSWQDFEIEIISKNIFPFARDVTLFS